MSLTIVDAYKFAAYNGATEETWYAKLYYGDESAFVGISSKDMVISGVTYYGIVTDWGEITESIDLANSSASISDMSINCANVLKGGKLSDVIYGTTTRFINRKVEVFSYLNATSLQLYTGKLINISFDIDSVTLNVEGYKPWQGISVPQTKSVSGIYEPLAYGDFVKDTNAHFCVGKSYYPIPFLAKILNRLYFVVGRTLASDADVYFYDSNLDKFIPITDTATATVSRENVNATYVPQELERTIHLTATADNTDNFDNTDNAYDKDSDGASDDTTYAEEYVSCGLVTNSYEQDCLVDEIYEPIGVITELLSYIDAEVEVTEVVGVGGGSNYIQVVDDIYGIGQAVVSRSTVGTTRDTDENDITANYVSAGNKIPAVWDIIGSWFSILPTTTNQIKGYARVYDCYLKATIALDFDANQEAAESFVSNIKYMYCGADGLSQSFTDGTGLAQLPHEILRDLLARFTDFDYGDSAWPEWSDLDTARSGWNCRWWQLEPRELEEILRQIQFEGCFIFKINNTATGARLIWVDDEYSSADFTFDENDYESINVSLTDMAEIETFTTYNYQRHPAKSAYIETTELDNSTARGYWLTGTLENKIEKNLDFIAADKVNTGSDPNDCLALYYDNIKSSPKIIVDIDMTNMAKIAVEVGDIVQFNDANINPFGKDWADVYFMVIETRRGINSISVKAREVYEA